MKTHSRYEFAMEFDGRVYGGDSPATIFELMTQDELGQTPKTKARFYFEKFAIEDEVPDVNDKDAFYTEFFKILRKNLIGTWKWYDSLYNDDDWRYSASKNDIVRRIGAGRYKRSKETLEKLKANIEKSHEARRNNPELARHIAHLAGIASKGKGGRQWTPEQRKERGQFLLRKRLEKQMTMTPEEREAEHARRSAQAKAIHERRRVAGLEYKGKKADDLKKLEIVKIEHEMEALEKESDNNTLKEN